ncbi:coiled-coil domain-containing protein 9-like isoform X1 [Mytilus edulis]|uniref:coiled-coil domain-containing protein 9-like isoform X1 n=1 Tax=Mytilus edulis TaxID=6550 RepID=UPI0039EF3D94
MKVFVILCVFAACMFAAGDPIPTVVPTPEQPSWNSGHEVVYDTFEDLYGRKEEAPPEGQDAHMHPPPPTSTEAPEVASEGEENEKGIEEPEEVGEEEVGEEPEEEDDEEEKEEKEEEEEEKEEEEEEDAEKSEEEK